MASKISGRGPSGSDRLKVLEGLTLQLSAMRLMAQGISIPVFGSFLIAEGTYTSRPVVLRPGKTRSPSSSTWLPTSRKPSSTSEIIFNLT